MVFLVPALLVDVAPALVAWLDLPVFRSQELLPRGYHKPIIVAQVTGIPLEFWADFTCSLCESYSSQGKGMLLELGGKTHSYIGPGRVERDGEVMHRVQT